MPASDQAQQIKRWTCHTWHEWRVAETYAFVHKYEYKTMVCTGGLESFVSKEWWRCIYKLHHTIEKTLFRILGQKWGGEGQKSDPHLALTTQTRAEQP